MNLTTVTGTARHINRVSNTHSDQGVGNVSTSHTSTFRLDGRHVSLDGSASWLAENDNVAIVGEDSQGSIQPLAICNFTTGYKYVAKPKSYALSVTLIIVGFITIAFMFGLVLIPLGIWLMFGVKKQKRAISEAEALLSAIAPPSQISTNLKEN